MFPFWFRRQCQACIAPTTLQLSELIIGRLAQNNTSGTSLRFVVTLTERARCEASDLFEGPREMALIKKSHL
jgi:hypothetical protein